MRRGTGEGTSREGVGWNGRGASEEDLVNEGSGEGRWTQVWGGTG